MVARVLVNDLSYRTVGSGILGLPGLRMVTMPGPPFHRGQRAELVFEATAGDLDPELIRYECERMGARDVEICEIMKDGSKTAANALAQSARHTQEGIRDAEIQDHRGDHRVPGPLRGQAGRSPKIGGTGA